MTMNGIRISISKHVEMAAATQIQQKASLANSTILDSLSVRQ
jgi:hypothetical protein